MPGASRTLLDGVHGDRLKVRVSEPPERGRANRAVEGLLSRLVSAPAVVVWGHGGRHKRVRIEGLAPQEVRTRLGV